VPGGPYETCWQAHADVAEVYERSRRSSGLDTLGAMNLTCLRDVCGRAGVTLSGFDHEILAWLSGCEPETCVVVAGLIARALAAGRAGRCRP